MLGPGQGAGYTNTNYTWEGRRTHINYENRKHFIDFKRQRLPWTYYKTKKKSCSSYEQREGRERSAVAIWCRLSGKGKERTPTLAPSCHSWDDDLIFSLAFKILCPGFQFKELENWGFNQPCFTAALIGCGKRWCYLCQQTNLDSFRTHSLYDMGQTSKVLEAVKSWPPIASTVP